MKRKYLAIGISTIAVILLILTSLSNVVGYQTIQTSQQNLIKERINQRELLFQTIVDIANNREVQRIILKSQLSREGFFNPGVRFPEFSNSVLTKNQIRQIYFIGLVISTVVSTLRMHSIIQQYQLSNSGMLQEISTVIEKNTALHEEIIQLSALNCECDDSQSKERRIPMKLCEALFCIIIILVAPVDFLSILFENMPVIRLIIAITIGWPVAFISIGIIFLMARLNCWGNIPV